jgi:hypothetical protein
MGNAPFRPITEIERRLDRGDLSMAIAVAKDRRQPLSLHLGMRMLPLVAGQRPDSYDTWALRWLKRWVEEMPGITIDDAAEVAQALAEIPVEPDHAIERINTVSVRRSSAWPK